MNKPVVFQSEIDERWYWHVKSPNGQIVAVGGEAFTRKSDAQKAMRDALTKTELADLGVDPDPPEGVPA